MCNSKTHSKHNYKAKNCNISLKSPTQSHRFPLIPIQFEMKHYIQLSINRIAVTNQLFLVKTLKAVIQFVSIKTTTKNTPLRTNQTLLAPKARKTVRSQEVYGEGFISYLDLLLRPFTYSLWSSVTVYSLPLIN